MGPSRLPSSNASRTSRFYNDIARHIIETFPYVELAKSHNLEVEDVRLAVLEKVVQPMLKETRAQAAREETQSKAQAEVQAQSQPKAQTQLHVQAQANPQEHQTQFQTANSGYHTNVVQFQGYEHPVYVPPYLQAPLRIAPVDPRIIDPALMNPVPKSPNPANGSMALQNTAHEPAPPQTMADAAYESNHRKRQISEVEIVDLAAAFSASIVQQGTSPKKVKCGPGPGTKNVTPAPTVTIAPTPTPEVYTSIGNPHTYYRITESTPTSGTITAAAPTPDSQPIVIDDEVPDFPTSRSLENPPVVVHTPDIFGGTRSESEEPLAARCRSRRSAANSSSGFQEQIMDNKTVTRPRNLYNIATQKDKEIWKKHVLDPLLRKTGKGGENLVDEGKFEADVPEAFNHLE